MTVFLNQDAETCPIHGTITSLFRVQSGEPISPLHGRYLMLRSKYEHDRYYGWESYGYRLIGTAEGILNVERIR